MTTLVCGAGGFIGGYIVRSLVAEGVSVRAVDVKPFPDWYQRFSEADNVSGDLARARLCKTVMRDVDTVYNLAADMGGMGFIENNKAACMLSVLINTHLLMAAREAGVERLFFASSA